MLLLHNREASLLKIAQSRGKIIPMPIKTVSQLNRILESTADTTRLSGGHWMSRITQHCDVPVHQLVQRFSIHDPTSHNGAGIRRPDHLHDGLRQSLQGTTRKRSLSD